MLSPDGTYLAYLAPSAAEQVMNVWVRETAAGAAARDLTPGEGVKASNVLTSKRYPDQILVGTNARNPALFDMFRFDYKTGIAEEATMDTENPGDVLGWGAEEFSFEIREGVVKNQEDSSTTVRIRDDAKSEWRDFLTFPYGEDGNLVDFCADGGKTCYVTSSIGRETTALLKVDLKTGETIEEIFSNDKCDIGGVKLDKDTKEIRSISYNYARIERLFFDKELEKDFEILKGLGPKDGEVSVASTTRDEKTWVVCYSRSDGPTEYVMYDQVAKTTKPLFVTQPKLLDYKFSPMEDVRIKARDGLELVGYLTRAATDVPTPLILP